jgi:peptidoglycan/LPS O-acetylase OafA/YrhL
MTETSAPPRRLPRNLGALDGLRAVAVAAVIGFHLTLNGRPLMPSGSLGVNLFFVLSGFLITTLLVRNISDHGLRYGNFLTRRVLRLAPALITMVGVVVLVLAATDSPHLSSSLHALPFALTYTSNIAMLTVQPNLGWLSHTWSLALEQQFYIVWPLLLSFLLQRTSRRTCCVVVTVLAAVFALVRVGVALSGRSGLSLQGDTLLVGCLAGLAFCWSGPRLMGYLPGAGLLAAGWAAAAVTATFVNHSDLLMPTIGYLAFSTLSAMTLLRLTLTPASSIAERALRNPVVRYLGVISYGIYLWHLPVVDFLREVGSPDMMVILIGPTASIALATASYNLVERPFLRVKDRLADRETSSVFTTEDPQKSPGY